MELFALRCDFFSLFDLFLKVIVSFIISVSEDAMELWIGTFLSGRRILDTYHFSPNGLDVILRTIAHQVQKVVMFKHDTQVVFVFHALLNCKIVELLLLLHLRVTKAPPLGLPTTIIRPFFDVFD